MKKPQIGHVHLKVRNLEHSLEFYQSIFDLELTERIANFAFLTGNDMHHTIALQALGNDAPLPFRGGVGLFHVAFEVTDKISFAEKYHLLKDLGIPVYPVDHIISWAMYFSDPDGNGMEIYTDTRHEQDGSKTWTGNDRELSEEKIFEHSA